MTTTTVVHALRGELAHRMNQAARAADLLRSAADRLEAEAPDETRSEQAARLRGSSVLAHTAALELAAASGWVEALATAEQNDADGGQS
ncbi:MAG TPA: hypothetical protein VFQ35_09665 [Polyangiaceae bacterium]|nr:hypothetical protein [Polyangiaceae bacterium]